MMRLLRQCTITNNMIEKWLKQWREWRERNEAMQKHASHRNHQVLTRGRMSILVQCIDCGLDEPLWDRHWCNVVRLTEPRDIYSDTVREI